ncbi:MAG: ArnT family glycosyltransferase [Candidatus Dormibacteria bacterium]
MLAGLFVALRLPSLVEPTWYADEGTYADIGRALDHGAVLYQQVWDNKPPVMYWLAAAIIPLVGASGVAFHAVLALLVGSAAAAVWRLGARAGGRAVATVATLTYVVLVSLPNLDGDLLNAEVVGAVLVVWAMVLATGERRRATMLGAGVLAALAVLTKAVFALDLFVLLAVGLLVVPMAAGHRGRSGSWVTAATLAGGAALALAVVTLLLAVGGSLRGFVDVLVHQDVDYVQLTGGPGGHIVLSRALSTRLFFTALLLERLLPPLLIGALAAWWLRRRGRTWPALVALWLGADVAGAVTSARGLTHYVQQLEPALALGGALVAVALWQRRGLARGLAVATVLATWPLLELCSYLPRVQLAVANNDPNIPFEHHNFRAAQLPTYYALSYRRLVGAVSGAEYDRFFPGNLQRMHAVIALFAERSRPGEFVYVWGTVHWSYARSDRVPSGQYTSLNDAYYLDPGAEGRLIAEVIARPPAVLVVDAPLPPRISGWLASAGYNREPGVAAGDDAWIAPATR